MTETDANPSRKPAAAVPSAEQAQLLDELGGPQQVANLIHARLGVRLSRQAISMWRRKGIPYRYRAALAIEARERSIGVPPNFLGEGEIG